MTNCCPASGEIFWKYTFALLMDQSAVFATATSESTPITLRSALATTAATTTFSYDRAGNPTLESQAGAQTAYLYDGENRLRRLTNPDGTISTYTYQGDGLRRTAQEPGRAVKTFVWDGSDYLGEI